MHTPDGIEPTSLTAWLEHNVPGRRGPYTFDLIGGGRSNLTFKVTSDDGSYFALRRPPTSHVLASAHDMSREFRIISALAPTDVPVPPALGYCPDPSVTGAPFYVMEFVNGHILRDPAIPTQVFTLDQRRQASESLVDVLVRLHAIDPASIGLGDLARPDAYIARQLRRWYGQFEQSLSLSGRTVPLAHELHGALSARIPEQRGVSIVHGDYRLDNVVYDDEARIIAVLDWEICTLGDAMADVAQLLIFWGDVFSDHNPLGVPLNSADGFVTGREIATRYSTRAGRELNDLDFYLAFVYWKLACMLEGVNARYAAGAGGGDPTLFGGIEMRSEDLFEAAHTIITKGL